MSWISNPEFYRRYRPFYPVETFAGLREGLLARGFKEPFAIADIGCGTGHSTLSLLRSGFESARVVGIDPDAEMLARARDLVPGANFIAGSAEATGLADASQDALLVGSAFHWMDPARTAAEFARVLRPRGAVRIFEYQFPKAGGLPELNEWIRRKFNAEWKAPAQSPRGDFVQVTGVFRDKPSDWTLTASARPPMRISLRADDVTGLILSQSRVLHYEGRLDEPAVAQFRQELARAISEQMGADRLHDFDFRLEWVEFERASTA